MCLRNDEYRTIEQFLNYFIEDEVVYYKPHLEIRMSNQENITFFFDTQDELEKFMSTDRMRVINWINRPTLNV